MRFRTLLCAVVGAMLMACDQDPFHLAERRVVGDYRLLRWEDGSTYYLVTASTRGEPGGAIGGTVAQIGWTAGTIVVRSKPLMGDSTWVLIDVAKGSRQRSAEPPTSAESVRLRPAAEVWADLK